MNELYDSGPPRTGTEVQVELVKPYRAYCLKDKTHKTAGQIVTVLDSTFKANPGMGKIIEAVESASRRKKAAEGDDLSQVPEGKPLK